MTDGLYTVRAYKYNDSDPCRGVEAGNEYTDHYVVVAESDKDASAKLLKYLGEHTRSKSWEISNVSHLIKGKGLTLEQRLEVLREVMPEAK